MGFENKTEKFLNFLIILQFSDKNTKGIQSKTSKYFRGHFEHRKVKQNCKNKYESISGHLNMIKNCLYVSIFVGRPGPLLSAM